MATQTNAIDLSHCVQHAANVGSTTYYDICAHTTTVVPWGTADWLSSIGVGAMIGFCILFLFGLVGGLAYGIATGKL